MKILSYLFLVLLVVSFAACHDDEESPTQRGVGDMVAKVNGKPWRHNGGGGVIGGGAVHVAYNTKTGFFNVLGVRTDDEFTNGLELTVAVVKQTGDYVLTEKANGSYAMLGDFKEIGNSKYYFTTAASTGRVTITKLDTQNKIISGTFSFRAQRDPAGPDGVAETVEVTEGWFDVTYR